MSEEGRTLIVSNRLPVSSSVTGGRIELKPSSGGLVTGLAGVHGKNSLWVGALGVATTSSMKLSEDDQSFLSEHGLSPVDISQDLYDDYYEGFSNSAVWPLFHYMSERCRFSSTSWQSYRKVNELFAEVVLKEVRDGDRVWIHDYQLMLLPEMLRRERRNLTIGFFLHIPFPSAEVFRILPWRRDVLVGLLGADLIGFHTLEYMRHFSNAAQRIMGLEPQMDALNYGRRTVKLGAFPLGVDVEEIHAAARTEQAEAQLTALRGTYKNRKVVLGVDRLDYTKGIPGRLLAFAKFLELYPEWIGKVSLVQISVPSRTQVEEYQELKAEVDGLVGRINGRFGTASYTPVQYIFRNLDRNYLMALYRLADACFVTPVRDGLNLVCKEYVAAKGEEPGALILSEFAGSAAEMGEAILVNPWSEDNVVAGLETALKMEDETKLAMMTDLFQRLSKHDNHAWSTGFLSALEDIRQINETAGVADLEPPDEAEVFAKIEAARRVFLFIDYDGTLVPLVDKPEMAVPTSRIIDLLRNLTGIPKFEVSVISGRDRKFLDEHLPENVTIAAEHGACIRRDGEADYVHLVDESAFLELRSNVLGVMRDFEQRIPGSIIEEKEFGTVWHYRMADPIFAHQQALVLADTLGGLLSHTPLGIMIAKKAVEVRHLGINKGEAIRAILYDHDFDPKQDFVLTMGDDRTDEDMFRVYPHVNMSIGVSEVPVGADYTMEQEALLEMLENIARNSRGWQFGLWDTREKSPD